MFSLSHPHGRRGIVSGFGLTRTNVWDKPRQIGQGEEAGAPHAAAGQYASSDEESGWSDGEAPPSRRSGGGGGGKRRPTQVPARHSVAGSGGGGRQQGGRTLQPRPATTRASVGTTRRGRFSVEKLVEGGGEGGRPGYVVTHFGGAGCVCVSCVSCVVLCCVVLWGVSCWRCECAPPAPVPSPVP